jgi:hypothetical protein
MILFTATLAVLLAADAAPDAGVAPETHAAQLLPEASHQAPLIDVGPLIPVVALGGLAVAGGAVSAGNGFTASHFAKDAGLSLGGELAGAVGGALAGLLLAAIGNRGHNSFLDGALAMVAGAGLGLGFGVGTALTLADPPSRPTGWLYYGTAGTVLVITVASFIAVAVAGDDHPALKVAIAILAPLAAASAATAVRSFAQ